MEIRLRDFRRQDFGTLWGIDQRCFPQGVSYTRQELASFIRLKQAFTLVAECQRDGNSGNSASAGNAGETDGTAITRAEIVGFIVSEGRPDGVGHVITIDVSAEARRSGVGSRLLTAAEARLRRQNCRRVFLETAVDNRPALAFYKRHRYFVTGAIPGYYSNGVDAFVLEKDLHSPEAGG